MSAGRRLGSTERGEAPEPASIVARFLELFALSGLAVAQPVLAVYADNSLELISRQVEGWSIVAFTVAVLVVPAAVLLAVEQVVALASPTWCERVHGVALAVLFGLFLLQIPPNGPAMGFVALALGVGGGMGFWFVRQRVAGLSTWLRFLAIAPLVFALAFLLSGGIADLVLLDPPDAQASSVPDAPPSVLFLVLDELPTLSLLDEQGEIDAERFPAIAELAGEGTWYPNHTTMASWTSLAVPGVLTGQYPAAASNQAHWTTYPENLFTLLGGSHDVVAHESATRLCPSTICPSASRSAWISLGDLTGSAGELWLDLVKPFDELEIDFSPAGVSVPKDESREVALEVVDELVADPDRQTLVGISGLFLVSASLLGLWIAWPRPGSWRAAFQWRRWTKLDHRLFGWHRALGLLVGFLFIAMGLTGAFLALPEEPVRQFTGKFMPYDPIFSQAVMHHNHGPFRAPDPDTVISPQRALESALQRFPQAHWVRVFMPSADMPIYIVRLYQPGEVRAWLGATEVLVNARDGQISGVYDALHSPVSNKIFDGSFDFHSGALAGLPGRVLIMLLGFSLPAMYITGVWAWLRKRRRKAERAKKLLAELAAVR
jgi:hypothetical protein